MRQGIEELKKETSRLREENLRYNRMAEEAESAMAVSYTHLTLPTKA